MGSLNTDRDIQMDIDGFFTERETYTWIKGCSLHTDRDITMDIGGFFTHR